MILLDYTHTHTHRDGEINSSSTSLFIISHTIKPQAKQSFLTSSHIHIQRHHTYQTTVSREIGEGLKLQHHGYAALDPRDWEATRPLYKVSRSVHIVTAPKGAPLEASKGSDAFPKLTSSLRLSFTNMNPNSHHTQSPQPLSALTTTYPLLWI